MAIHHVAPSAVASQLLLDCASKTAHADDPSATIRRERDSRCIGRRESTDALGAAKLT